MQKFEEDLNMIDDDDEDDDDEKDKLSVSSVSIDEVSKKDESSIDVNLERQALGLYSSIRTIRSSC